MRSGQKNLLKSRTIASNVVFYSELGTSTCFFSSERRSKIMFVKIEPCPICHLQSEIRIVIVSFPLPILKTERASSSSRLQTDIPRSLSADRPKDFPIAKSSSSLAHFPSLLLHFYAPLLAGDQKSLACNRAFVLSNSLAHLHPPHSILSLSKRLARGCESPTN